MSLKNENMQRLFLSLLVLAGCALPGPTWAQITFADLPLENQKQIEQVFAAQAQADFSFLVRKYRFFPERIKDRLDSLQVLLLHEHQGNWRRQRQAFYRLTYTWEILGYYLLLPPAEARRVGEQLGFRLPHDAHLFFKDPAIAHPVKTRVLQSVREKCLRETGEEHIRHMDGAELMKYAFHLYAPQRLADYKAKRSGN